MKITHLTSSMMFDDDILKITAPITDTVIRRCIEFGTIDLAKAYKDNGEIVPPLSDYFILGIINKTADDSVTPFGFSGYALIDDRLKEFAAKEVGPTCREKYAEKFPNREPDTDDRLYLILMNLYMCEIAMKETPKPSGKKIKGVEYSEIGEGTAIEYGAYAMSSIIRPNVMGVISVVQTQFDGKHALIEGVIMSKPKMS